MPLFRACPALSFRLFATEKRFFCWFFSKNFIKNFVTNFATKTQLATVRLLCRVYTVDCVTLLELSSLSKFNSFQPSRKIALFLPERLFSKFCKRVLVCAAKFGYRIAVHSMNLHRDLILKFSLHLFWSFETHASVELTCSSLNSKSVRVFRKKSSAFKSWRFQLEALVNSNGLHLPNGSMLWNYSKSFICSTAESSVVPLHFKCAQHFLSKGRGSMSLEQASYNIRWRPLARAQHIDDQSF